MDEDSGARRSKGGLRVLLLTTDTYGAQGGIGLYNRDLIEALCGMPDVADVVVVPRNITFDTGPIPEKVTLVREGVKGRGAYVLAALQASRQRYDLFICGHINLLPLVALLKLGARAPLVMLVYGIDVWKRPYAFARQWLGAVDAVWAISAITRERMNEWARMPRSRFSLLPNAIHIERYGVAAKRADLIARYGLKDRKVLMTLARLPGAERYKGIDEVLEVMPRLLQEDGRFKYLVVGEGSDRKRLEAKAKALGLADDVVFTGTVSEGEKADHFRLSDVFVMPGRGEGFGFVFLEALACGVPAVGSTLDGSREALLEGELGQLVDPREPQSIYNAILRALDQPKGVPQRLSVFAWPAFCAQLAYLTHGVLDSGSSVQGQA